MATLLDGVNEVLKRTNFITSGAEFTSLTDPSRQVYIDVAVQVWREAVEELYSLQERAVPTELREDTITLVAGVRNYALATDLIQMRFPLLDETNHHFIFKWGGDYHSLVNAQPDPTAFRGLPNFATIDPRGGANANTLFLDREPTTDGGGAGRVYKYRYDGALSLSAAADTFPFKDIVFRALVPAVAQFWNREQRRDFDAGLAQLHLGRAARLVTLEQPTEDWMNR